MSNVTLEEKPVVTKKHRRTVAEIREEFGKFVEYYQLGLTPFEIMKKLNISKVKFKIYFSDALSVGLITLATHSHGTCAGKHLPREICDKLQATKEDLIRFESTDETKVVLSKVDM